MLITSFEMDAKRSGMQEGIELGMQQEKLTTALSLKKMGMELDNIVTVTGLKKEEIECL